MSSLEPIEITEYQEISHPIEIPLEKLEKFYSDFKNYFKITPSFKEYKEKIKKNVKKHKRFQRETGKFRLRLRARYYIGLVKFPDFPTLIIKPKFDNVNFLEMLKYVEPKLENIIFDLIEEIKPESNFLNILIDKFLSLTESLLRSSFMKSYHPKVQRTRSIKGQILIRETLQDPSFLKGKIVCNYDDFTVNIKENQIIKSALYKIRFISDSKQQARIRQLFVKMEGVTLKDIKLEEIEKIRYNRFNQMYKKIHNYCKMIIGRFSFGFQLGKYEWFCMLLNSWSIYERFLRKILKIYLRKLISIDLETTKKHLWEPWDDNKLIPDIEIKKGNQILLLCDAKYKFESTIQDENQGHRYLKEFRKKERRGEVRFDKKNRNFILIYPSNQYNFDILESHPDQELGIVYAHSIDLSQVKREIYLESWVLEIANKFKLK